tara:strand:- start:245 stop:352 length:108 start_codon:yes stop_codon:yes gene_type:complete
MIKKDLQGYKNLAGFTVVILFKGFEGYLRKNLAST